MFFESSVRVKEYAIIPRIHNSKSTLTIDPNIFCHPALFFCNNSIFSAFTYIIFGRVLRKLLAKFAFFSNRFSLLNAAFHLLSGWIKEGLKGIVATEQYKNKVWGVK